MVSQRSIYFSGQQNIFGSILMKGNFAQQVVILVTIKILIFSDPGFCNIFLTNVFSYIGFRDTDARASPRANKKYICSICRAIAITRGIE